MNKVQQDEWKFEAISQLLSALAENENIRNNLIFKGTLILNHRLHTTRKSLDIDSNLAADFVATHPREKQISFLKEYLENAISHHFERQEPVRFKLTKLKIKPSPQTAHPRGWDGFSITVSLLDYENSGVRGLPPLTIDMAAPETYSKFSYSELQLGQTKILAYSLERIAVRRLPRSIQFSRRMAFNGGTLQE